MGTKRKLRLSLDVKREKKGEKGRRGERRKYISCWVGGKKKGGICQG